MTVTVFGLWHLGAVTAACLAAAGHLVTGLDFDPGVVSGLNAGRSPVFEPGLDDLLRAGLATGRLAFTTDARAVSGADVVWVTYDTPVDEDDRADVEHVLERVRGVFPFLRDTTLVLISSQLPVGTTRHLEQEFADYSLGHSASHDGSRNVMFAYSPENLRLGKAISAFTQPDRIVAGVSSPAARQRLATLLDPLTNRIEWMSIESAEMTKHALNAFLATSVTFINEIAALCEQVGADAAEVERGLKSEHRIGPGAYLAPGGAFAGGTLARDVVCLSEIGSARAVPTHLLRAVKESNDAHRQWAQRRLEERLDGVKGKTVAVWGLTYKPGTDTLRRSSALELCQWLRERGAAVRAHDPVIAGLPATIADGTDGIVMPGFALAAADGASALVVATPWPEYRHISARELVGRMARPLVLDANRFLNDTLGKDPEIEYVSVGRVPQRATQPAPRGATS